MGIRRLTPAEIAAARWDPRFTPRPPLNPRNALNESEQVLDAALNLVHAKHDYENLFFPTQFEDEDGKEVEYGICPDFPVTPSEYWPQQYVELTLSRNGHLSAKRIKIHNAERIHDKIFVLITAPEFKVIERDLEAVGEFLTPYEALAVSAVL